MDSKQKIKDLERSGAENETEETESVDEFIRELEEKEKDLHITAETTVIELAEGFEDEELPDFMKGEFQTFAQPAPSEAETVETEPTSTASVGKLEHEIAALKARISQMEGERNEILESSQRRARDFESLKTRTERERKETFENQIVNLAIQMLPALDNLNRALDFVEEIPEARRVEIQQFLDGVVLINQQVLDVLAGMGIRPIASVGKKFDPRFHEAVAVEETDSSKPGMILAEVLRGYRVGDRVIRHSMVKVAKSPAGETQPEAEEPIKKDEPADLAEE